MTRPPRVVLDTNIVLSALVFTHGRAVALREAWQGGWCEPLVSKATVGELIRVLGYPKFKLDVEEPHELVGDYLPWCRTVAIPAKPPRTPSCRDPFDLPFLQLAVVSKADFLVSGDQDLLGIQGKLPCPIVTLDAFLAALPPA
jgi:putative PIN family toxin of toxin-antitoxin system